MRSVHRPAAEALNSVAGRYQLPLKRPLVGRRKLASRWIRRTRSADRRQSASLDSDQKLARLEAVLFLARESLSTRKLSQYANLADGTEARTLVRRLNRKLDQAGRAFRVEQIAGGYQMTTRPKFAKWLCRVEHVSTEQRLSAPSLETLAVVAYRQPVMRAEIESIRGVSCGEVLNQLLGRDLIRVGGRSDELGRPYLYNTTKRFLKVFGLMSLDDLPRADVLRAATTESVGGHNEDVLTSAESAAHKDLKVEEETDVTVSVEQERQLPLNTTHDNLRMEDEDFDGDEYEYEDDDEDDDEDDEDEDGFDEDDEDEDGFDEDEDEDEDDLDADEFEEFEDDDGEEDDEDDLEYDEEELDDEDDDETDDFEDEDWEEVDGGDEDLDDDDDEEEWDDDDWDDEEEWD